jgi:hypothetical protein
MMNIFRACAVTGIKAPKTEAGKAFIKRYGPVAALKAGEIWREAKERECARPAK